MQKDKGRASCLAVQKLVGKRHRSGGRNEGGEGSELAGEAVERAAWEREGPSGGSGANRDKLGGGGGRNEGRPPSGRP